MSSNPYVIPGRKPCPRLSAFVYLDILGYQDMARAAGGKRRQLSLLRRLHDALARGRQLLDPENRFRATKDQDLYVLKAFTDNIVIGWPVMDDAEFELGGLYSRLAQFQLDMALSGFFVRGAISVGDAYVDDVAVFGPALLEAYEGESKQARDPRVILAPSARDVMEGHVFAYYSDPAEAPQNSELLQDADGQVFVNYLDTVLIALDEYGPFYEELLQHKARVEERLDEFRALPTVWTKYVWVARYHNYFCGQYPSLFGDSHKIDPALFSAEPRRLV